ncbi:MAG TPA: CoA transferase [Burkholderiales bacterium]|nr:CoA transferase [Burkholderiales bacterium]
MKTTLCDLSTLAATVPDGAKVAVPADRSGVAMTFTRELVRRRVRDLHLVCVPVSGLQAEVMIGAGLVATLETSAVTLDEFGPAPRFVAAVREGAIKLLDATCPAIHAALQAGQKGIPFIPLRGLIGTDVLANRPDWKVIDNPFHTGDPIVVLPAIRPDFALFHAPLADRYGNVFIGRSRELMTMAHAAHRTLVTVEEVSDVDLMRDPDRAPGVIPSIYITALAEAPRGAWPLQLADAYGIDEAALLQYVEAAQTARGFERWIAEWLAPAASEKALA